VQLAAVRAGAGDSLDAGPSHETPRWLARARRRARVAAGACTMLAAKGDYADYRAVRLAPDADSRQVAMQHYVARHPDGRFTKRCSASASSRSSPRTRRAAHARRARALPGWFPDGELAPQARSRLAAIDLIESAASARPSACGHTWLRSVRLASSSCADLDHALAGYWISTRWLALKEWGAPIPRSEGEPGVLARIRAEPRPACSTTEC